MLTFDLREEAEPDPMTVSKLVEKFDVMISIKPKPKLSVKSVNIRGYERNSSKSVLKHFWWHFFFIQNFYKSFYQNKRLRI